MDPYRPPAGPGYGPGQGGHGYGPGQGVPGGFGVPSYAAPVPAGAGLPPPVAVDPVHGTPFGVAIVPVAPTSSGPASSSLVAGIGSILVSLVVSCFGLFGASSGWGPLVAGAFAVLAACAGGAAVALGLAGLRQIRRGVGGVTGRGLARSGVICGVVGLSITVLAVLLSVVIATSP